MNNTSRLRKQAEDTSQEEEIGSSLLGTTLLAGGAGGVATGSIKKIKESNRDLKEYDKRMSNRMDIANKNYLEAKSEMSPDDAREYTKQHKARQAETQRYHENATKAIRKQNNIRKGIAAAAILGGGALVGKEYNNYNKPQKD